MVRLRKIVFILCLIGYLLVCPLTLLYAFGIIVRPEDTPALQRTGLIAISTIPDGATIQLDGQMLEMTSPALLSALSPGRHAVRLLAPDHHPWTQTVQVRPGRAVALDDVRLPPLQWTPQPVPATRATTLQPVPRGPALLLSRSALARDWLSVDSGTGALRPLLSPALISATARVAEVVTAPGSDAVVLVLEDDGTRRYHRFVPAQPERMGEDLTPLFVGEPAWITWDKDHPRWLAAFYADHVDLLDRIANTIEPTAIDRLRGGALADGHLYGWTAAHRLVRRTPGETPAADISREAAALLRWRSRGLVKLFRLGETWLGWDARGHLAWSALPRLTIAQRVLGVAPHPRDTAVLVWTKHELGVVELAPSPDEHGALIPRVRWLVRDARDLRQADWIAQGRYIAYRDRDVVWWLQLWQTDQPDRWELARVAPDREVAWPDGGATLYYLDRGASQLMRLEVIPEVPP